MGDSLFGLVASGIPFASTALNGTCAAMPVVVGKRVYVTTIQSGNILLSALDFHDSMGSRLSVAWSTSIGSGEVLASPMLLQGALLVPTSSGVKLVADSGSSPLLAPTLPAAQEIAADPRGTSAWLMTSSPLKLQRYGLDGSLLQAVDVAKL